MVHAPSPSGLASEADERPRFTFAIGDIHGRLDLLERAADAITDYLALREALGHVICLGDYVDRGPDSKGVIDFLMEAERLGALTCLKGNHEELMLEGLAGRGLGLWIGDGGGATLASYGDAGVPDEHKEWLAKLPSVLEADGRIFVHAGLFPGIPLSQQDDEQMMWIRDRFLLAEKDFAGWPHIVHGHTPVHLWKQNPAEPELLSWRTNLDTGAFHTGVLTVGVFADDRRGPIAVLKVSIDETAVADVRKASTEGRRDTPNASGAAA